MRWPGSRPGSTRGWRWVAGGRAGFQGGLEDLTVSWKVVGFRDRVRVRVGVSEGLEVGTGGGRVRVGGLGGLAVFEEALLDGLRRGKGIVLVGA